MDCSPLGSSVHGISQARTLEGFAFSSPWELPDPGVEPMSPDWQADSLPQSHLGSLCNLHIPGYFCHLGADMYIYVCVCVFIVFPHLTSMRGHFYKLPHDLYNYFE